MKNPVKGTAATKIIVNRPIPENSAAQTSSIRDVRQFK
jgi:hypothetical protein